MVQRVAASTQWAEQVPVAELELGAGAFLPGTQATLVGGGGGAEVWLDGKQMGIVCGTKTHSESGMGVALGGPWPAGQGRSARGGGPHTCFAGLDADGLEARGEDG